MSREPLWKADARRIYVDALVAHRPTHVFALFSGGSDSIVLTHWAKRLMGRRLDAAVFIDTGTALPGVREFVENYCIDYETPLKIYEAGDEYDQLVAGHGFPGPASHRYAYVRLKERQLDALIREHKRSMRDRIMLLTGVRRSESTRRMGTVSECRRVGATVWVAPLIDWTDDDMRAYRQRFDLPQSDAAALMHRSGECNCGAFAAPGERQDLLAIYPEWFEARIAPLERLTGEEWGERRDERPSEAGPLCSDCQLRLAA